MKRLPQPDVLQVRLTARSLYHVASDFLFTSITIRNNSRTDMRLTKISSSPIWTRQVQTIIWDSFGVDPYICGWDDETISQLFVELRNQCRLLHNLTNVEVVQFTSNMQEDPHSAAVLHRFSFIDILQIAKLHPELVKVDDILIRLKYNREQNLMDIKVDTVENDCRRYPTVLHRGSFEVFGEPELSALRLVHLARIEVPLKFLEMLFCSKLLEELRLEDVFLENPFDLMVFLRFLRLIRDRKNRVDSHPIRLDCLCVQLQHAWPWFSATDEELTSWAKGLHDEWFRKALPGFNPAIIREWCIAAFS